VLEAVREFRRRDADTPVVLMGYLNPVEMRGASGYAAAAVAAGVDGVLLVDLPPEEAAPFRAAFGPHGLALISLAAPTTSAARLARLAADAEGYVYYVSLAGVTGAALGDGGDIAARTAALRAQSPVPVMIGFGIKDAASAAAMGRLADGVVVGSALVDRLAAAGDDAVRQPGRPASSWRPCARRSTACRPVRARSRCVERRYASFAADAGATVDCFPAADGHT
jgi:tryptophan synthase alpha chain